MMQKTDRKMKAKIMKHKSSSVGASDETRLMHFPISP